MAEQRPWHRWFGMSWKDFFRNTSFAVEAEKEMSVQQQRLDVLVLRRGPGPVDREMPDGFEELAAHNLVTFKSHHEAMDEWTLTELIGHFVAYRKLASPSTDDLLPVEDFRLFAVSARSPRGLAGRTTLHRVREGVYDVPIFTGVIRLVVVRELPQEPRNAMLFFFDGRPEQIRYGLDHHELRSPEMGPMLLEMFREYRVEGAIMADVLEEYARQLTEKWLKEVPVEKRLEGVPHEEMLKLLTPEERLKGVPPEERLKGLPPEERLKGVPPEERLKGLPPEERLKGLSVEEIIAALPPDLQEAVRAKREEKP